MIWNGKKYDYNSQQKIVDEDIQVGSAINMIKVVWII